MERCTLEAGQPRWRGSVGHGCLCRPEIRVQQPDQLREPLLKAIERTGVEGLKRVWQHPCIRFRRAAQHRPSLRRDPELNTASLGSIAGCFYQAQLSQIPHDDTGSRMTDVEFPGQPIDAHPSHFPKGTA